MKGVNVYRVYEGDRVIFEGEAHDIVEELGLHSCTLQTYVKYGTRLQGKYKIVLAYTMLATYQLITDDGRVDYEGTNIDCAMFCQRPKLAKYMSHYSKNNLKIGKKWHVRKIENKIGYVDVPIKPSGASDKNYQMIKRHIEQFGNTGCKKRDEKSILERLKKDGIDCYSVPMSTDRKWCVLYAR